MSKRVEQTDVASILRRHRSDILALQRGPGRWIYVGDYPGDPDTVPESPPFEDGWVNSGVGFARCRFRVTKWREVEINGAVEGGAVGTVIFTLPLEYRPDASLRFACASNSGTVSVIQVDPTGEVIKVS